MPNQYKPPYQRPAPLRPIERFQPQAPDVGTTFFHQSARVSWMAPIIAFFLGFCTISHRSQPENRDVAMAIGIINSLLIAGGFVLAIVALFGIPRHGAAGILGPAIAGLIVNAFLIGSFFTILRAHNRAAVPIHVACSLDSRS